MNQEWAELNRTLQAQLQKKDTFEAGISTLLCRPIRKNIWGPANGCPLTVSIV